MSNLKFNQQFNKKYKTGYNNELKDEDRKDLKEQARIKLIEGDELLYKEKADEALNKYEESAWLFRRINDAANVAMVLFRVGEAYELKERYNQACSQYEMAFDIFTKLHDIRGKAAGLNNMGKAQQLKGDLDKAFSFYEKSFILLLSDDCRDKLGLATVYNNIAAVYEQKGKVQSALDYYEKSLAVFNELGSEERVRTIRYRIIDLIITSHNRLKINIIAGKSYMKDIIEDLLTSTDQGSASALFTFAVLSDILGESNFAALYNALEAPMQDLCREYQPGWAVDTIGSPGPDPEKSCIL